GVVVGDPGVPSGVVPARHVPAPADRLAVGGDGHEVGSGGAHVPAEGDGGGGGGRGVEARPLGAGGEGAELVDRADDRQLGVLGGDAVGRGVHAVGAAVDVHREAVVEIGRAHV